MPTFAEWVTEVKIAYQGGTPSRAQLLTAVKDGARAMSVRDTESDLQLAQSYQNRFEIAKVKLAGSRFTETIPTTVAAVRALMPIDDDTDAMTASLDNSIETARAELDKIADKFDAYLIEAAIELQRHVPFFQARQLATYTNGTAGVTNSAFISRVALPVDARVQQIWFGHYYPPLAEGVDFMDDDIVVSNGRLYKAITGGTLGTGELGAGLLTTDGTEEALANLSFAFVGPVRDFPARSVPWPERQKMIAGQMGVGPCYAMTQQQDELWFFPKLDDTHRFDLEYAAVAQSFEDADTVTFDRVAAKAAAHYIRGMMAQTEERDGRAAAASLALFQRSLREAALDYQDREAGSPVGMVPYDWARHPRICGFAVPAGSTTAYPNGYAERYNDSGDIDLVSSASNMVIDLTIAGMPRDTIAYLKTAGRGSGDMLAVSLTLPPVAGIDLDFRDKTSGASLLPEAIFTGQQFETDGETLSAVIEFVFNGTAWEYAGWRSPA